MGTASSGKNVNCSVPKSQMGGRITSISHGKNHQLIQRHLFFANFMCQRAAQRARFDSSLLTLGSNSVDSKFSFNTFLCVPCDSFFFSFEEFSFIFALGWLFWVKIKHLIEMLLVFAHLQLMEWRIYVTWCFFQYFKCQTSMVAPIAVSAEDDKKRWILKDFDIEKPLGQGASGCVYLVREKKVIFTFPVLFDGLI